MPPGDKKQAQTTSLGLLERARRREPQAWERLVALYRPLVLFWCKRAGARGADAEDVSQEVFAAAAGGLERFRRDRPGDTFRGWLCGITRNQVLLFYRRTQHQILGEGGTSRLDQLQEVPDPLAGPDAEEQAEVSQVYQRALEQVRGDFAERTWQAFCRTVLDGRSPASLTAELGMTAVAIRQAKARVLRRLKEEVGDLLD
ncbi:MAG TPA: sigma-70 family RNA polymerase sigma factor [Gemmataceae bacterium]|jgi:RNA polymerase sigma-70 factor (ECF subfamily)|nr:sigma-70 family RNA polymerase sigma factor [Gemmataceae bacterium]